MIRTDNGVIEMAERNLNFDRVINRKGTNCLKYDFAKERGYQEDILPLWVADMDFPTTSYVEDALVELAHHNIYGYTNTKEDFFETVAGWMKKYHRFDVKRDWHFKTPGVCVAIANAIRAFTRPGDAVIIQKPVYYPFSNAVLQNERKLVSSDLIYDGAGHYSIDFDDFEKKIREHDVKLFILCNPHNPVGRVWTREELMSIGKICRRHHVIVFSDEIHFDFVWRGEHHIFQEVDPSFREFSVTATSPSKTFNLAGLQQSNIFIPNPDLYSRFKKVYDRTGLDEPGVAGVVATKAAYTCGQEWYEAMKKYVRANIDYAIEFVNTRLKGVNIIDPEGTYLIWLDFNGLGLSDQELEDMIVKKAKLWLDRGSMFGENGRGFERINAACPRSVLKEALERISFAIDGN